MDGQALTMEPQNARYDRQLRLWQAHGQEQLQQARICLIGGSVVGVEALKNLILPGIGSFTILDDSLATGAQAGRNFFLTKDSIGTPRAEVLVRLLGELNGDVSGHAVVKSPVEMIASTPEFFESFTLVIATELPHDSLRQLARVCWDAGVTLVATRVCGFFGYCRIIKQEHPIVEAHGTAAPDFRFDRPFPAMSAYLKSIHLAEMDSMGMSHIPYVVLIFKALDAWLSKHDGALPKTSDDKSAFKKMISDFHHPDSTDDENIAEALANAYRAYSVTKIPSDVAKILDDEAAKNPSKTSSDFWLLVAALRKFVAAEGAGLLPVSGIIPDMKADTDSFIKLQSIYRAKAREDQLAIRKHLDDVMTSIGRVPTEIKNETVDRFCKNSASIKLIRYRSLEDELSSTNKDGYFHDDNFAYYWLFRASDRFQAEQGRLPGTVSEKLEEDYVALRKIVDQLNTEQMLPADLINDNKITEFVRAGATELHAIAAIMGGIVSQEVIKLLTCQYTPADNTILFNGIASTSSAFRL